MNRHFKMSEDILNVKDKLDYEFLFYTALLFIVLKFVYDIYTHLYNNFNNSNISNSIIDYFTSNRIKNLEHKINTYGRDIQTIKDLDIGDGNFASFNLQQKVHYPSGPSPFNISSGYLIDTFPRPSSSNDYIPITKKDNNISFKDFNILGLNACGELHKIEHHNNMIPETISQDIENNLVKNQTNVAKIKSVPAVPPSALPRSPKVVEKIVYVEKKDDVINI